MPRTERGDTAAAATRRRDRHALPTPHEEAEDKWPHLRRKARSNKPASEAYELQEKLQSLLQESESSAIAACMRVGFGRQVCFAERPACRACPLAAARVCPQIGLVE